MAEENVDLSQRGEQTSPVNFLKVFCANCENALQRREGHCQTPAEVTPSKSSSTSKKRFKTEDPLCLPCRKKAKKNQKQAFNSDDEDDPTYSTPSFKLKLKTEETLITAQIPRTAKSNKYCLICHLRKCRKNKNNKGIKLLSIPKEARYQIYERKKIYIPKYSTVCPDHLTGKIFKENEIDRIKVYCNETVLTLSEFVEMREKFGHDFVINPE